MSRIQDLTNKFYQWERRGRGWHLFDAAVDVEPPFQPFYSSKIPTAPFVDDGLVPTWWQRITSLFEEKQEALLPVDEIVAYRHEPGSGLAAFSISIPKSTTVTAEEAEQLLLMLSTCNDPVSFEIIATSGSIRMQLTCREQDERHVISQLKAYFPECIVTDVSGDLEYIISRNDALTIADFGLQEEFMRPLCMDDDFSVDPLIGIFGAFESLQPGERAVLQILFKGAVDPWAPSIWQSVTDSDGKSFFLDAPEMPKLAKEKISSPLFGVVIRVVGQAKNDYQADRIAENLARILMQTTRSSYNTLIPLSNDEYTQDMRYFDVLYRQSHRLGMLLNSRELVTLVHIPSVSVVSTKLEREIRKTKVAPPNGEGQGLPLGINIHQGKERLVTINAAQRFRHVHVIGATGTGKSTLLQNLIMADITAGSGCAVLDPHGDLVDTIIASIPNNRLDDVVIVDPSDAAFPVAFNILLAHSEIEKDVLSSDLVAVFRRLSTSWGDAMNSVFANGILAFLESSRGGTLMDLRRFFVEKPYREEFLKTVSDPSIVYYWTREYSLLKSNSIGPILTRLDAFLRPKPIRNMVAQHKGLDFAHLMDSQKIVLVKLPQGLIGVENSYILGSIFVSKIYQTAMARQSQDTGGRRDFFLYVDEFQHFITPSMSHILSGARKYHLGLTLAHQDMQQLVKEDAELASSVISNAGTRICFRLGDTDAKRFEDGFATFDANDLQNLRTGEAIARIERPENDFNLSVIQLPEKNGTFSDAGRAAVIAQSRNKYATPREEVERIFEYLRVSETELTEDTKPLVKVPIVVTQQVEVAKEEPVKLSAEIKDVTNPQETIERIVKQKELSQHRYLQMLIKRMGEARGFKADIEVPTKDGQGRVDVSLERNGKRIACEIGVTTTKDWEVHNIEKCLADGFEIVVAISNDTKAIETMQRKLQQKLPDVIGKQVYVINPESLFLMLDMEVAKEVKTEKRMKGYRIKTEYDPGASDVMKNKKDFITKVVLDSMKKK